MIGQNEMFKFLLVAVAICVIGFVGQEDYEDEVQAELLYCQNVRDGVWPDFKEMKNICRKVLTTKK